MFLDKTENAGTGSGEPSFQIWFREVQWLKRKNMRTDGLMMEDIEVLLWSAFEMCAENSLYPFSDFFSSQVSLSTWNVLIFEAEYIQLV